MRTTSGCGTGLVEPRLPVRKTRGCHACYLAAAGRPRRSCPQAGAVREPCARPVGGRIRRHHRRLFSA
jgi:hypothetical protein